MDIKIPSGKGSEDSVHEILKVVQEIKTSLNGVDGKLVQVLLRISTLEATVSPLKKNLDTDSKHPSPMNSVPKEKDANYSDPASHSSDCRIIGISNKEKNSSAFEENASNDSDCQFVDQAAFEKKDTKRSSFVKKEPDDAPVSSDCQIVEPSSEPRKSRPRKVNQKLRSPLTKLKTSSRAKGNKELSKEELVCILYVKHYISASPTSILVHIGAYNAWVSAEYLKCLTIDKKTDGLSKWLGDYVMEAYAKLIMHRHAASVTAKRFYVWNVFHCKVIPTLPGRRIKSAEQMATTLTENERVSFPMIVTQGRAKHWILLVMNNQRKVFQVLDSLWELSTYRDQINKMILGIDSIIRASTLTADILSWDVIQQEGIPQQRDGCSCGLYVLKFIELWNGFRLTEGFEESDVHAFRVRVLVDLLLAELNDVEDVKKEIRALTKQ